MPGNPAAGARRSVRRLMAVGLGWMIAARWSIRGIGVLSTIVLARLLSPIDFGLVAMGMVTVAFVRIFAEAGQHLAIIRHPDPTSEHFDTAWTMSVCGGVLVALALLAIAPVAGRYFHEPRAVPLIRFLAFAPLIEGFTNIGAAAGFLRDLSFGSDFRFLVVRRFSTFAVTMPAALVLRDYRALAIGIVVGRLVTVAASFWMHPYRPRLRLTKLGELWSFSAWTQLGAVGQYLGDEIDQITVGGLAGAAPMGGYNVARDVATSPTYEIVIPAARSLFPIYATLLDDPARLAQSYLEVLSFVAIVALATGVGVAIVAKDLVAVLLGSKWSAAAGLVPWLAIGGAVLGVTRSVNAVISVTGNARLGTVRNWTFVALLASAAILSGLRWGSEGVAVARMAVTVVFAPVMFYTVMRVIPVNSLQILARIWRPALAALAMAAAVWFCGIEAARSALVRLICNAGIGAAAFGAVLLTLWVFAGRPAGAESVLFAQAHAAFVRLSAITVRRGGGRREKRMAPFD